MRTASGTVSGAPKQCAGEGRSSFRRGFTLLELVIVIAVAGILFAGAYPASARIQQRMRLENAAEQVARDLTRAKSEAIKNNAPVSFDRTGDATYQLGSASRKLPESVRFREPSSQTIRFAAFGPPLTGAGSVIVELGGKTRTVSVTAGGLVTAR